MGANGDGPDQHVQMLVDVVVPYGHELFGRLAELIELLSAELHRHGLQEAVWVARLPEDRA
jgi:hypothetical protein